MRTIPESIQHRARLLRQLRGFFDERDFFEVQPACLSRDCVVDAYLDPIVIESSELRLGRTDLPEQFFLQTSPESVMKRMLAAGAPSIYSLGPVFRSGERGPLHNTEFTMLEWYEVGGNERSAIQLLGRLVTEILGYSTFDVQDYRQAFAKILGLDPIDASMSELQELVQAVDPTLAGSTADQRDAMLDVLLSERVQPSLGNVRPIILRNYPLSQAALAKPSADDPDCAARFEIFFRGIELANGYDELLDAEDLARRAERNNAHRRATGRDPLRVETSLVEAMRRGLPSCAGVALGVDRLLMLSMGADTIDQVIPFPIEKA